MNVILAPHLDDEILGCYSILDQACQIIYFTYDYREDGISSYRDRAKYCKDIDFDFDILHDGDTIYIPSKFDYHPLHRKVRRFGLSLPGKKMFYSVEMNTPWLEEEEDVSGKRALFEKMYPYEDMKSDKYFLFKSIQPFDDLIWATIKFQREFFHRWPSAPEEVKFLSYLHRHLFHFTVQVQQFGDDRDLEYFILSRKIQQWWDMQKWSESTSCEQFALAIKRYLEIQYMDRLVKVSVFEDDENGAVLE